MERAFRKIAWRIHNYGIVDTVRWIRSHYSTWSREKSRGIDTSGRLRPDQHAVGDCNGYEPIMYECLDCVFDSLEIKDSDVLVDYGSGKGRVLIEAALRQFKRIDGVEYDLELVKQSEHNITAFKPDWLGSRIIVHHCDAREFQLPEDVTHIFLWNSFVGELLASVVARINDAVSDNGRSIKLIVALPENETSSLDAFHKFGVPGIIKTRFWTGVDLYSFGLDLDEDGMN